VTTWQIIGLAVLYELFTWPFRVLGERAYHAMKARWQK